MTPEQYIQLEAPTDEQTQALWDYFRDRWDLVESNKLFHQTLSAWEARLMSETEEPTSDDIATAERILRETRDRVWNDRP